MKIVGFRTNEGLRLGVVEGEEVIDLQAVDKNAPNDLGEWLRRDNGDLSPLKDLARRAPASARRPLKGLDYAYCCAARQDRLPRAKLSGARQGTGCQSSRNFPRSSCAAVTSPLAHGKPMIRLLVTETLDWEAEMVVVVGKRAKHLDVGNAYSCIAGYSCFNEGSVREFQRKTSQWDMGKNFDSTGAFGPWMVTADELPPGGKGLKIQTRLNGEVMQSDTTDNMMFPVAETIAYITQGMTLESRVTSS